MQKNVSDKHDEKRAPNKQDSQKRRKDCGARWTKRDRSFWTMTGEQFAMRIDQALRYLGSLSTARLKKEGVVSESTARHLFDRYIEEGLMICKKIDFDDLKYCWLTRTGYREANLPFGYVKPTDLEHIYWNVEVRLWCAKKYPSYTWRSERWLAHEHDAYPAKVPDALLIMPDGSQICIEVERTQKNEIKLLEHLQARTMVYEQVWYFSPASVAKAVEAARQQLDRVYAERVTIIDLDSLCGPDQERNNHESAHP
jgi:hypothetical protein